MKKKRRKEGERERVYKDGAETLANWITDDSDRFFADPESSVDEVSC